MKKCFSKILCLGLVTLGGCQTISSNDVDKKAVPRAQSVSSEALINSTEVVAVVNTQVNSVDLEQQAAEWGYSLKKKEKLAGLDMYIMIFDCPPGIDPYDAVVELEKLQPNSTVGVNHKYDLNLDEAVLSTTISRTYADNLINWPESGCKVQMPIGIIDGGISDSFLRRREEQITYRSFIDGKASSKAIQHGSAITSILAQENRLYKGDYYVAAVVSEDKNGDQYSGVVPMLKALDWMIENGVKVVNVSLAGPKNNTLEKAINQATSKGMIIIAAVGNDGKMANPQYPAAFDSVIAATAVNKDRQIYEEAVRGSHIDFAAPGVSIYVPDVGEGQFVSGTSIAAPFVTALVASHTKNGDDMTVERITKLLSQSTVDLGDNGKDPVFGRGLIKAKADCSF